MNGLIVKTLYYIFIFRINDVVIKLSQIVRIAELGICLSNVTPVVFFVQIFDNCVISLDVLNGVLHIDIYL